MAWSTSPSASPASFERGRKGLAGQRHVELLPEALLPDVRVRLAGHAPAVQELVARRPPADQLGHRALRCAQQRGGAVPAVALLGRARQAGAQVRDHRQRGATAPGRRRPQRLEQRTHGRARRAGEVIGTAATPEPQRRVHRRRARLVQVRRVRRREEQVLHGSRPRAHGQRTPAGLDAERRRVLVVGGHGTAALAAAAAQDALDGRTLKTPEGQVRPPGRNAAAHGPIIPDIAGTSHVRKGRAACGARAFPGTRLLTAVSAITLIGRPPREACPVIRRSPRWAC